MDVSALNVYHIDKIDGQLINQIIVPVNVAGNVKLKLNLVFPMRSYSYDAMCLFKIEINLITVTDTGIVWLLDMNCVTFSFSSHSMRGNPFEKKQLFVAYRKTKTVF